MHKCGGEFIILNRNNKNEKIIICQNCKLIYKSDEIIMYCPFDKCEFYSKENNSNEEILKPATWEKYHCPIMLNQQMKCNICNDYLWILNNNLFCKKCNIEFNPNSLYWKCIICQKKFKSNIKEYNKFEFIEMKNSVKNALINQIIIKPINLPCKCHDKNPLDLNFYHNKNCDGILYEGENFLDKKILVCSKCKTFVSINKYNWICPICERNFHCEETKSFYISDYEKCKNDEITYSPIRENTKLNNEEEKSKYIIKRKINKPNRLIRNSIESLNFNLNNLSINSYSKEQINTNENSHLSEYGYNYRNDKYKIEENNKKNINNSENESIEIDKGKRRNISFEGNYSLFTDKRIMDIRIYEIPEKNQLKDKSKCEKEINKLVFKKINNNEKNVKNQILEKEREKYNENSKEFTSNHFRKRTSYQKIQMLKLNNNSRIKNDSLCLCNNSTKNQLLNNKKDSIIFNENDYKILTQLGEGTFGKIYLVEDINKNRFCLKKIFSPDERNCDKMIEEYLFMSKIKHNNIVSIIEIKKNPINLTANIIMEVAITDWEKEINERSKKNIFYTEKELFFIIKQLINALSFLQKKKICHRDIKTQNILIFKNNNYKIADFGEIKQIIGEENSIHSVRGTHLYMSPILFKAYNNKEYNIKHNPFKSDVFSLGLCFLFASTLNINNLFKVRDYYDDEKLQLFIMSLIGKKYSFNLILLLSKMLTLNEFQRPDFIELEKEI